MLTIRNSFGSLAIIGGLIASLNFVHAQTTAISIQSLRSASADDMAVMLQAVEATTPTPAESVPPSGTFWSAQNPNSPPMPCNINNLDAWNLGDGVYLLDDLDFDYQAQAQSNLMMQEMADGVPSPGDGGDYASDYVSYTFDTNALWLEITNVGNGLACLNLHNATNQVYAIWSTTNLLANWNVETEVWPEVDQEPTPFTVPMLERQNLFLLAEDWTGVTENGNTTPDWWFWEYFGTVALSDTNLDSQGNTLLNDYTNSLDPNVIQFALSMASQYINTLTVPVQINLLAGVPSYYAVLVNDINQADANWQAYTGTNITVNLGSTDGVYTVSVGLRGLPPNATATWQAVQLTLDTVAPTVVITNPAAGTVSQPMIQVQGYANKALSQVTFDVSNATGIFTNQTGYITSRYYDLNRLDFTTNWFQCYDIVLTNGLNTVILHATDLAGNTTTTNVNFILDYSGDTTPPTLTVIWPQDGTYISGSSFIFEGQVDDDTASVIATIVDASGDTNTVQALVERSGAVWAQNLPLAAGTNTLTISATDAAGNTSTTDLTLYQSSVTVTVNPLAGDQLNRQFITVTGTVSDTSVSVVVNGVTATVNDDGTWEADSVPVSPAGMAKLDVEILSGGSSPAIVRTAKTGLTVPANDDSGVFTNGSLLGIITQPAKVVLSGYFGTRHYQSPTNLAAYLPVSVSWNEDDEVNWTYDAGGSWYFYAANLVITTNGNYNDVTLFSYSVDPLSDIPLPLSPDTTNGFYPATVDPNAAYAWEYDGWSEPPVTLGWGLGPGLNFVKPPWEFSALNTNIISTNPYSLQRDTRTTVMIVPSLPAASGQTNVYLVRAAAREFSDPFNPNVFGPATVNYNLLMFAPYPYPTSWDFPVGSILPPGWLPATPTRYLGDVPLPPEWLKINGQTLINSGVINADGSVWGLTVVSAPSGATVDVTPTLIPTVTLKNNDYTFDVQLITIQSLTVVSNSATQIDATNWAVVKSPTNDYVIIQATLNYTNDWILTYAATAIQWTGGEAMPGNPLQRRVTKTNSVETTVTASLSSTSTNLNVWVVWATVNIVMSGNNSSPLSFDAGYLGTGDQQLGVQFYSYSTNNGVLYDATISNGDSVLGKVCAVATVTPAGIHTVLTNSWDFIQMKKAEFFFDGVFAVNLSSLNWTNDSLRAAFKTVTLDNNDKLYAIDAPGIVGAPTLADDSVEIYDNFYDYVTWNSQNSSDTNNVWHLQARWKTNQAPQFTLVDLGDNTISLPQNSFYPSP